MAANKKSEKKMNIALFREKPKIKRRHRHAKKHSSLKSSKRYVKSYAGQGR